MDSPAADFTWVETLATAAPPSAAWTCPDTLPPRRGTKLMSCVVLPAVTAIGVPDVTGQLKQDAPSYSVSRYAGATLLTTKYVLVVSPVPVRYVPVESG